MRYFSYFFFALQLIKIPFLHNGIVRIILLFLFLTVKREPRAIETGFRRKNIFIVFNNEWASCCFFSPFASLPIAGNLFSKLILKDIFACLFSIHDIISLSCHEQVSLSGLNLLVHDMINLNLLVHDMINLLYYC